MQPVTRYAKAAMFTSRIMCSAKARLISSPCCPSSPMLKTFGTNRNLPAGSSIGESGSHCHVRQRGTGMTESARFPAWTSVDDVRAVMDAVGIEQPRYSACPRAVRSPRSLLPLIRTAVALGARWRFRALFILDSHGGGICRPSRLYRSRWGSGASCHIAPSRQTIPPSRWGAGLAAGAARPLSPT